MDTARVEAVLDACESAQEGSGPVDLGALGFWRAVRAVKLRPEWAEQYADRIAAIDRRAFERAVRPTFPPTVGTAALTAGTAAGLLLVAASYAIRRPWKALTLLTGAAALLVTTHDLAHLAAGRAAGIRFTHWFLNGPLRFQPGLKVDYASYLRTAPRARGWMHASERW